MRAGVFEGRGGMEDVGSEDMSEVGGMTARGA